MLLYAGCCFLAENSDCPLGSLNIFPARLRFDSYR